jgi:hypothetical protein
MELRVELVVLRFFSVPQILISHESRVFETHDIIHQAGAMGRCPRCGI